MRALDRKVVQAIAGWRQNQRLYPIRYESRTTAEWMSSWCWICADKNATEVAQQKLRVYTKSKEDKKPKTHKAATPTPLQHVGDDMEEMESHPLLDLLKRVNPILDQFGLWWLTTLYLQFDGNAYWHVVFNQLGYPMEIWPLPSQHVALVLGTEQVIDGYEFYTGGTRTLFSPDEIVHFRRPSPLDMVSGMGSLRGVLYSAETNLRLQEYESALLGNNAVPDLILSPKGDISEDQVKSLDESWQEYKGWRNRGRHHVAPFTLDVHKLSETSKDMQFPEGRKAMFEQICAGFGVPINIVKQDGITYQNMRQGTALWMRGTVAPILRMLAEVINTRVMPLYTPEDDETTEDTAKPFVGFDNPLPDDIDADTKRLTDLATAGLITPNEARRTLGYDDAEWGDEPYIPAGTRRLSDPIPGITNAGFGGEGEGKPPAPQEQSKEKRFFGRLDRRMQRSELNVQRLVRLEVDRGLQASHQNGRRKDHGGDPAIAEGSVGAGEAVAVAPGTTRLAQVIRQILAEILEAVLATVGEQYADSQEDSGKAARLAQKQQADPPINPEDWIDRIAELSGPIVMEGVQAGVSSGNMDLQARGLETTFQLDPETLEATVREQTQGFASRLVELEGERLADAITEWLRSDEGLSGLYGRIREAHSPSALDWVAEMIGRTEMIRAQNAGAVAAYHQADVSEKRWLASANSCEFCRALDGKAVKLEESFVPAGGVVAGQYGGSYVARRGAVDHPPLHPHCTCTVVPVIGSV